ncbi:MAG: glycosyltransferase [Paludibacter sp.]
MNVLFLTSWYPTPNNPGFGIFVKEHAKAIDSAGVEIVVLAVQVERSTSFFNLKVYDFRDESDIRTVQINISSKFRDLIYHFIPLQRQIAFKYYKKIIAPVFSPDIVHSNVVFPAGMLGDFIAGKINKPHIITEHWSKVAGILQKPYLSGLTKGAYKRSTKILPVSEFLKKNLIHLMPSLNSSKFSVVPNVINSESFTFKKKQDSTEEIKFCAVATWATKKIPDKKPELFIEALEQIQFKSNKKITLTMVGGGDRVEELQELCVKKSYKTEFLGFQTKEQISKVLQNSDYFVHASTIETFGIVIVEALMTGTPVICSNVGALPELIDASKGVLCENTVEEWIEGIVKAIALPFDNKAIANNVENKFSTLNIGKKLKWIYEDVLK